VQHTPGGEGSAKTVVAGYSELKGIMEFRGWGIEI
jgi:hypothetical protein